MRTQLSRDEVRAAIPDAADRLLARRGYKKMTVGELAREARIGKGTVYLHFASKEEVALSHVDAIVERLKERLREASPIYSGCHSRLAGLRPGPSGSTRQGCGS